MTADNERSAPEEQSIELITARCVLRPVVAADAGPLHALWTSPGVRRFLWDDEIIPLSRTHDAVEQSRRMFAGHGAGLWAAWPSASPALIGFAGLWPFRDPPELELLYGVSDRLWGRGYAVEIAQAVMSFCGQTLEMPAVRASTDAANVASVRVLEKLGFRYLRRTTTSGLDTVFYEKRLRNA